jgi:WD40 repeat protein/RsiW-degrading membrane proteinase PrsW (M82 family)
MSTSSPDTVVLCKSTKQFKRAAWLFLWMLLPFIVFIILSHLEDWAFFWQKAQEEPTLFVLLIGLVVGVLLFPLMLFYQYRALKRERLILDASGIHYQSHLPSFLQALSPKIRDWSAQWSEITAVYLKPPVLFLPRQPLFITLGFHIGLRYHEIFPCQWINPDDEDKEPFKLPREQQWRSPTPEQAKTALQRCPLIKYLTDKGIEIEVDPKLSLKTPFSAAGFALESNRHSLTAMILFFLLVAYAVLDFTYFNQETYAEQPLYEVYLWGAVGMAILVMGWLIRAKVPKRESVMLALLVGGAFGAALYPGLLRLNQLTDQVGLTTYQYELQSDLSFKPVADKTLPTLYLDDDDYWSEFETGSIHEFQLRKGGLGFYQINLAPIEELKATCCENTEPVMTEATTEPNVYVLPDMVLHTLEGHKTNVLSVAFSPDGNIIASGSKDKTIKLWEASTGKLLQTLLGHRNKVQSATFSPDGTILASGSEDNTIKLWEVDTGKVIRMLKGHDTSALTTNKKVFSVAFSPDGNTLASGNWDKSIMLWQVDTGKALHFIKGRTKRFWGLVDDKGDGHADSVNSVVFSPDGSILASGGFDHAIKLWDVSTGTLLKTFKGHSDFVLSVTFSPDGNVLASSSYDKSIKLWEVNSGKVLRTMRGHTDAVTSVALSPDGQILASGSFDRTIKLWEVSSGKLLSTLKGHSDYVNTVVFSPDGNSLASASGDDTVKLWHRLSEER